MNAINDAPLWSLALGLVGLSAGCFLCGQRLGKRQRDCGGEAPVGAIVAAVMALLAFMLTFTFGIAAARFEERRQLILEESNAIGTAYLRADFLEGPEKFKLQDLLRNYVLLHLQVAKEGKSMIDTDKADALLNSIWQISSDVARAKPTPVSALLVSITNDVIDLKEKRVVAAFHAHVPPTVWITLLFVSIAAMSGVGLYCGRNGTKASYEAVALIASYSIVLILAFDLDRSSEGLVKTNQQPILDLAGQIGIETRP